MKALGFWTLLLGLLQLSGSSLRAEEPAATSTQQPDHEDEDETEDALEQCKIDLRLSGSVYDAADPEHSFAVLEVPSSHASAVYRVGARVGLYELVAILPRGAVLRNDDGECWLRLVGGPVDNRPVAAPAKPAKPKKKKGKRAGGKSKDSKASTVAVIGGS
jgi:hypothetical protein